MVGHRRVGQSQFVRDNPDVPAPEDLTILKVFRLDNGIAGFDGICNTEINILMITHYDTINIRNHIFRAVLPKDSKVTEISTTAAIHLMNSGIISYPWLLNCDIVMIDKVL